jgi:hypothetical protein
MVGIDVPSHGPVAKLGVQCLLSSCIEALAVLTERAVTSPGPQVLGFDVIALGAFGIVVIDIPRIQLDGMPWICSRHRLGFLWLWPLGFDHSVVLR